MQLDTTVGSTATSGLPMRVHSNHPAMGVASSPAVLLVVLSENEYIWQNTIAYVALSKLCVHPQAHGCQGIGWHLSILKYMDGYRIHPVYGICLHVVHMCNTLHTQYLS